MRRIIPYELLQYNKTITAELYCQQLQRLSTAIARKRPALINCKGVILQQDNARLHTARMTQALVLEKLLYLPYSPDIAPFGFNLFCSLDNYFTGKKLNSREQLEN